MRTIKFRGKSVVTDEWVYGLPKYGSGGNINYICGWMGDEGGETYNEVEIDPLSLGQFTEFIDDSNHEIYEGDVVNYVKGNPSRYINCVVRFGEYQTYTHINKSDGDVEEHTGFYLEDGSNRIPLRSLWIKKIGNIYDNRELIQQPAQQ